MTKKSSKKSRRKVNKSRKLVIKKSKPFSPIRFSQPRTCKVSSKDPSKSFFNKRLWLKSKIGNGRTYSLATLIRKNEDDDDFYVLKLNKDKDFTTIISINVKNMLKIVYEQEKAVLGLITLFIEGDIASHQICYVFVPPFLDQPATFYMITTYDQTNTEYDGVKNSLKQEILNEFDPERMLDLKFVEVNEVKLQEGDSLTGDELCVSWSLMILYYLTKVPQEHFIDGLKTFSVLPLNKITKQDIINTLLKLKSDVGSTKKQTNSTIFQFLWGSG
jgi:hypothetical protein